MRIEFLILNEVNLCACDARMQYYTFVDTAHKTTDYTSTIGFIIISFKPKEAET